MDQKKTTVLTKNQRTGLLSPEDKSMSMRKQCEWLDINRSSLYYVPKPENPYNLELMDVIDEEYTRNPFKGVGQMTTYLRKERGKKCGPKRVRRLLRKMGLEAICPKPNTSKANKQHKVYPYLLRNIAIERCNQVWSTDIT